MRLANITTLTWAS